MASPTADTYAATSGTTLILCGRNAVVSPPLPPIPAAGAYRTTQQWLFADVLADTVVADEVIGGSLLRSTPARAGVSAPAQGYLWSAHGPHRSYVDLRGGWPWVNAGGDWINASGTPQATSSPHFEFAANAATTGSAQYSVTVTAGAQAAQTGDRWHAYIVTGSARALVGLHHDTLPAPSVAVSYTDGSTATLQCVACVGMPAGTSYTQTGRQEHPVNPTVALEFERPIKAVNSAVLTITVAQHTSTASTISGYIANPPVTVNTVVPGVAASYPGDVGLSGHSSVLVSHRYQDGSTLGDWVVPQTINVFDRSRWDLGLLGLGADDTTKLPTAHLGTPLAGKWFYKQDLVPGSVSLVNSSHSGDGFQPLAAGLGALRVVIPKSTAADGATVPGSGSTGADLWLLFPKAVSGTDTLKRTFTRFYFRFTASAKRLTSTKMFRNPDPATAKYATQTGKWGVGVHQLTSRGGNNRTGGDGLGWSNRLVFEQTPTDMPVAGLLAGIHSLDMFNGATTAPAGNVGGNLPFGKNGGRGASVYPDRWYCVEVECDLNTWDAGGSSPYDGVQRVWLDGVLVAEWTGVRYRNGPLDAAGAGTDLPPFRVLGPIGLWLNEYMGGILPADEDRVCFYTGIACGTNYIGPMVGSAPSLQLSGTTWTPNRDGTGAVVASDLAQLPANSWVTVAGTDNTLNSIRPAGVYPNQNSTDGFGRILTAWGGGAWDATLKRMHISGGGHGDSSAAETGVYTVDATTMRVSQSVARQALNTAAQWNGSALVAGEPWGSGINTPTLSGVPGSSHTYYGLVHLPTATMAALGLGSPVNGGLFYPGSARAVVNLDTGAYTKVWWKRSAADNSYVAAIRWGNKIILPRDAFYWDRWDMAQTETTDWTTSGSDPAPGVPSFGKSLAAAISMDNNFVEGPRTFLDMPELGVAISFAGSSTQRMQYGAAQDSGTTTWTSYQSALTLTGADAGDLNTAANFTDSGTNLLNMAGASYLHSTGEVFVCPNIVGNQVYRITGLASGTTGVVTKIPGSSLLTTSTNGTFGRFRVFQHAGCTLAIRIASVTTPVEVMRIV